MAILVAYITGIHVSHAESRIFVTSAMSHIHSEEMPVFSFEAQSCIRGYHIYKAVWTPYIGETMLCSRELTNGHDPFVVKVSQLHGEDERIVGHLPRKISSICSIFLRKSGKNSTSLWHAAHEIATSINFEITM